MSEQTQDQTTVARKIPPMKSHSFHQGWSLLEAMNVPMVWIESLATAA